jgi:hypothetical protein
MRALFVAASCATVLAAGCGPGPLFHGTQARDPLAVANAVAASAIDDDPPADALEVHCRFDGVSVRLADVYTCAADYEGAEVTLRLEHDRLTPRYRYTIVSSTSRWEEVGATGTCVYNANPGCAKRSGPAH